MPDDDPGGLITDVDKPDLTILEIMNHVQKDEGSVTRKLI